MIGTYRRMLTELGKHGHDISLDAVFVLPLKYIYMTKPNLPLVRFLFSKVQSRYLPRKCGFCLRCS